MPNNFFFWKIIQNEYILKEICLKSIKWKMHSCGNSKTINAFAICLKLWVWFVKTSSTHLENWKWRIEDGELKIIREVTQTIVIQKYVVGHVIECLILQHVISWHILCVFSCIYRYVYSCMFWGCGVV